MWRPDRKEHTRKQVRGSATVAAMAGSSMKIGEDFSNVRPPQTNGLGAGGAAAYAAGTDIHLGAGQAGAGAAGKSMLAHELSHVVQQGPAKTADIEAAVGHYAR